MAGVSRRPATAAAGTCLVISGLLRLGLKLGSHLGQLHVDGSLLLKLDLGGLDVFSNLGCLGSRVRTSGSDERAPLTQHGSGGGGDEATGLAEESSLEHCRYVGDGGRRRGEAGRVVRGYGETDGIPSA